MNTFILHRSHELNPSLLLVQDENGTPIELLVSNLFKDFRHLDTTARELIEVLRWSMKHNLSTKTNVLILDSLLKKLDEKQLQDVSLMPAFLKLHNDYHDLCFDMWKHKLEKDFHPGYWLIAAHFMPNELPRIKHFIETIGRIKTIRGAYLAYPPLKILTTWHPSNKDWELFEQTLSTKVLQNLVGLVFYTAVLKRSHDNKSDALTNHEIGYACSKVLERLPDSKINSKVDISFIKQLLNDISKLKGRALVVDGINAIELMSQEHPQWHKKYGDTLLTLFLTLAQKDSVYLDTTHLKLNELDCTLQKLLESDAVPFYSTIEWWNKRFNDNKYPAQCAHYIHNINPSLWNIPSDQKINWIKKLFNSILEKQNGIEVLDALSNYSKSPLFIATTCFDLMSDNQWLECTKNWATGTVRSLVHQLGWLHIDHPRINSWKNSEIGKKTLCAALLHYLSDKKKIDATGAGYTNITMAIESSTKKFSNDDKNNALPHPFKSLVLWLPQYTKLYQRLSVELLSSNGTPNIDKLITGVSSFCTTLLEQDINVSALINVRDSIGPNMDFISLLPPIEKKEKIEELYDLPKATFDNESLKHD